MEPWSQQFSAEEVNSPDFGLAGRPNPEVFVDQMAWKVAVISAAEVERRILEGEDRIEVFQPNGGIAVYEVPRWRDNPIGRLRIALARRKRDR